VNRQTLIRSQRAEKIQQIAQLLLRDHAAGWVSFGQKWKTVFCRQYRSIFNHCDITGLQSYRIWWKKSKIRAITPFKVICAFHMYCRKKMVQLLLRTPLQIRFTRNWTGLTQVISVIAECVQPCHCGILHITWLMHQGAVWPAGNLLHIHSQTLIYLLLMHVLLLSFCELFEVRCFLNVLWVRINNNDNNNQSVSQARKQLVCVRLH